MDFDDQLKITLLNSLVGSVLTYGLHITPLKNTQISALQSFYSNCIRSLTQKRFSDLEKPTSNSDIREKFNIPTIESKLRYYRFKMYASWKHTLSIAYLNNTNYIHEQLNQLNNDISTTQSALRKHIKDGNNTDNPTKNHPLYRSVI